MEGEMKERRKIQFSVPSAVPTQLDPRQVEMIRRRRPTPATLFRLTDHPSPEEENPSHQLAICENGGLKSKSVNTAVYQPPSFKAVQKLVEAHMQSSEKGNDSHSSESSDNEETDRDQRDDPRSDQSVHHSGSEVCDEVTGSTQQQDIPGEEAEEREESKEAGDKTTKKTGQEKSLGLPDDVRCEQTGQHSVPEISHEVPGSTRLHEVLGEEDKDTNESKGGMDISPENTDHAECKEKGED
ncbi:protein phosphatase 1 regulatory subunit 1B-like [Hoplias malabaricus]|uniref:protein phosphatase 1 regulatory subunit 1B-like n=1 Tax=Hoplias malabaricus TaxID=27720 RepID=UPI003462199A